MKNVQLAISDVMKPFLNALVDASIASASHNEDLDDSFTDEDVDDNGEKGSEEEVKEEEEVDGGNDSLTPVSKPPSLSVSSSRLLRRVQEVITGLSRLPHNLLYSLKANRDDPTRPSSLLLRAVVADEGDAPAYLSSFSARRSQWVLSSPLSATSVYSVHKDAKRTFDIPSHFLEDSQSRAIYISSSSLLVYDDQGLPLSASKSTKSVKR
jgi:hypothetical protein